MLDDGRWRYCCYSVGELWRPVDGCHFHYRIRPDRCLCGWCPTIRTCSKCSRVFFLIFVAVVHCNLNSLADFFVEIESSGTLFIVAVVSASAHAISRIPISGLIVGFAFATVVDIWTFATARIRHVLLIDRAMLIYLKMTIRVMYTFKNVNILYRFLDFTLTFTSRVFLDRYRLFTGEFHFATTGVLSFEHLEMDDFSSNGLANEKIRAATSTASFYPRASRIKENRRIRVGH